MNLKKIVVLVFLFVCMFLSTSCGEKPKSIVSIEKTQSDGLVDTYMIIYNDGTTYKFTITNGEKGEDGHTPVITIQDGKWFIDGVDSGKPAEGVKGDTGNSILSITKTNTVGLVDTYTITFTDGTTYKFTITNGSKGEQGEPGTNGEPGPEGQPGSDAKEIADIRYVSTEGIFDIYEIVYNDGSTTTFELANPNLCEHSDLDDDLKCDGCLRPFHYHRDRNDDLKCDICEVEYDDGPCIEHLDDDQNCECDWCSRDFHIDKDDNFICDKCGTDYDDGLCSDHIDMDVDCKCDWCSRDFHIDRDDNFICDICNKDIYKPKWSLNKLGFDGKGMTIKIKYSNCVDPFDENYIGMNQELRQIHQRFVEKAYNIKIEYVEFDSRFGPSRVTDIATQYQTFINNDCYIVDIISSWLPILANSGALASLGTLSNGIIKNGILSELSDVYLQGQTANELNSVKNNVYGLSYNRVNDICSLSPNPNGDYFIYYNIDLVEELGLTDPAELWFQGKWTLSNFEEWVKTGQTNMSSTAKGKYVIDMGYPEFTIGLVASTGGEMVDVNTANVLLNSNHVISVIEKLQQWDDLGYYNAHGVADVSTNFLAGETVLHSGSVWFLRSAERFDPGQITFKIGAVPYPADDGQGGIPIITQNKYEALLLPNGQYLQDDYGNYIKGLDLSSSTYRTPIVDSNSFSVLNFDKGKNGITPDIVTNILIDLMGGEGENPTADVIITPEEAYKVYLESKLDYSIHAAAILSAQNNTYFDPIEIVSRTVGGGSHFSGNALWMIIPNMIRDSNIDPRTALNEAIGDYKAALKQLGYQAE